MWRAASSRVSSRILWTPPLTRRSAHHSSISLRTASKSPQFENQKPEAPDECCYPSGKSEGHYPEVYGPSLLTQRSDSSRRYRIGSISVCIKGQNVYMVNMRELRKGDAMQKGHLMLVSRASRGSQLLPPRRLFSARMTRSYRDGALVAWHPPGRLLGVAECE